MNKIIPDFHFNLQGAGEVFEDMKQMGLSGAQPLGEAKTKAPNSDYRKLEPPVAARQAEVARDYLKRAARIDELNGHPPGSEGQMVTALKRYNGGRVLVFVMGAFVDMSEDVSRISGIIANDLARTHVSYYKHRSALRGTPGRACPQPEPNATELPSCAPISALRKDGGGGGSVARS